MRRGSAFAFTALLWVACNGGLFHITVRQSSTSTVERGTLVEQFLTDFGFGDFAAMDLTDAAELQNQGVAPGDIKEVRLELFELEATSGGDLSFLHSLEFYVEAPDLPRVRIAWQNDFPAGETLVDLELDDVDLTEYVTSERMTFSTEVDGQRPDEDTDVEGRVEIDVGVTGQGACNNI